MKVETLESAARTLFRKLPIDHLQIERDEVMGWMSFHMTIGHAVFIGRVHSSTVAKHIDNIESFREHVLVHLCELQRILDEAEDRGREKERKGILGQLEARTAALGWIERLVRAFRRLRRIRRRERRIVAWASNLVGPAP